MGRTLLGATAPGQNEPGCSCNEGVINIPQISKAIKLFRVISMTLVRKCLLPLCRYAVGVFFSLSSVNWALHGLEQLTERCCWKVISEEFSSSSSCCAASADVPGPLSPPFSLVHHSQEVFQAISCVGTVLLYIGSSWSSCFCSFMWRGPQ